VIIKNYIYNANEQKMKLQVLQENFSKSLSVASRFSSSKVQLPVLANILLTAKKNKLLIQATNLETSISLSVGAKIEKEGDITIPARVLTDLVTNIGPGQLILESDKEQLTIKASGFNSTIAGMNTSDFPDIPTTAGGDSFKMSAADIAGALSKVLFAVSVDETRPVLTGVLFVIKGGKLNMVATDGFRLSVNTINIGVKSTNEKLILPKNALSELARLSTDENDIVFSYKKSESQAISEISDAVLTSRVIEGEFPDYERIIPKDSATKISVDKDDMLRSVKLASVFAKDSANVIKLSVKKTSISVSAESSQSGNQETSVDAKVEGDLDKKGLTIAFNYRFLEDFLNSVENKDVSVELNEANSPAIFKDPEDKNFLHIIMPVKVSS
jgi:DNA polymerase-3 subunit beta